MEILPNSWFALMLLVLVLGLKHGLDADHLAMIDGLTRFNIRNNRRVARWCGFLFSLGHGTVVVVVSVVAGMVAIHWALPQWVDDLGAWISIFFLTLIGVINLRAVLIAPAHKVVRTIGIKGRFLGRLQEAGNPLLIAAIGALFALSFDTLSQATLYALTATQFGSWQHALVLGMVFALGMMTSDSINSLWISRLLRRSDQMARFASRIMGLMIAGMSLSVAAFGVARYFSQDVTAWSAGKELYFGIGVIAMIAASYFVARHLVREAAAL
ncbi:MAG: nickel transporter [Betaproteobacteria bacterium HGW-Betaproteobacteria-11]|nr:MAG: nickel transporter [Betaproteobacteria bacterium HGW-Betaproteobacteria-11]